MRVARAYVRAHYLAHGVVSVGKVVCRLAIVAIVALSGPGRFCTDFSRSAILGANPFPARARRRIGKKR